MPPKGRQVYLIAALFASCYLVHINLIDILAPSPPSGKSHGCCLHSSSDRAHWTDSHSPYHVMDPGTRIAFKLHSPSDVGVPDRFLSVKPYTCGPEKGPLPPSLAGRTVLNFTASIATDLRIVHVGDSLGQQFAQGFDATALSDGADGNRIVLAEYFYEGRVYSHNCLSVAAPVRGGGVSAYWRVTDLMSSKNRRREAACAKEDLQKRQRVGWSTDQALSLAEQPLAEGMPVGAFDAAVMRIPHGWMSVQEVTRERIVEAINLAHDNLGVDTVVVTTLPLNNNVLDAADWRGVGEINEAIREIAASWSPDGPHGVKRVLVQEFGQLTNQILYRNAQHLGLANPNEGPNFARRGWEQLVVDALLRRLAWAKRKWPPSVPQVCADTPGPREGAVDGFDCKRNRISTDGIHWCIETLGPRYAASIACLLGCVYNSVNKETRQGREIRACERECNEQFMSIKSIKKEWMESGVALFSRTPYY